MKKVLIVILCLVIAVVACLGGMMFATRRAASQTVEEAYPDAIREVSSAAELSEAFADRPDLCVYDLGASGVSDVVYQLRLDGKTEDAAVEGYTVSGTKLNGATPVAYQLICDGKAMEYISADEMPYRGIPLEVSYKQQTEDCENQGWCLTFPLKGYSFSLWACYSVKDMSYEDMADIYTNTYYELLDMAEAVIDSALDG